MTPNRIAAAIRISCAALTITGFAHTAPAQAQTNTASTRPLAVGLINSGAAEAQVVEAVRDGDILTIKLRFKPLVSNKIEVLYSSISKKDYENDFYVLAGNKKHLLLTDSNNQPLASPKLVITAAANTPNAGTWYGRFPAPPKNITQVSLTIPGVETIDGIKIADR